jgi:hypothetical protein
VIRRPDAKTKEGEQARKERERVCVCVENNEEEDKCALEYLRAVFFFLFFPIK